MKILSIGECMVELAPQGEAGVYVQGFAGDTFNTAWYLAALAPQMEVSYLSCVGEDLLSDRFLAEAEKAGIGTAHVARIADRTLGLYLIALENGEPELCLLALEFRRTLPGRPGRGP